MATVESDIFKPTKFGGKYTVTLIPGDGIGAEVSESVKTIFKQDNVPVQWEQIDVTGLQSGTADPEVLFRESVNSLKRNKVGLKGTTALISFFLVPLDLASATAFYTEQVPNYSITNPDLSNSL